MTHEQRNEAISRKIAAYTEKFTVSRAAATTALEREGLAKPRDTQHTKPA
jgi:hypothetical protein